MSLDILQSTVSFSSLCFPCLHFPVLVFYKSLVLVFNSSVLACKSSVFVFKSLVFILFIPHRPTTNLTLSCKTYATHNKFCHLHQALLTTKKSCCTQQTDQVGQSIDLGYLHGHEESLHCHLLY